jgi:hypothetical protein
MKCFCDIDYSLVTSIFALIVALLALYIPTRYQIVSLINAQLSDKAKECNSNLDPNNLSYIPPQNDKVSGILSAIITAEELLNYKLYLKKSPYLIKLDVQSLIDQFYLQLHTTIRLFIQKEKLDTNDITHQNQLEILQNQHKRSKEFLSISISRDNKKIFENLHSLSLKRNKEVTNNAED